jgi:hypothetical protein
MKQYEFEVEVLVRVHVTSETTEEARNRALLATEVALDHQHVSHGPALVLAVRIPHDQRAPR